MSQNEILGLHRITKKHLKELCKKHRLYQTPHLNDQLYLHYQGFQAIENLEEYTGLKCLWLESNAISEIQGLESLTELKCLFLQNNLISKIENLQYCPELDTLNLASNHITRIENCGVNVLPVLSTLNLSRNYLRNSGGLQELVNCKSLWSLDLANNRIDDILVVKIFASMPELRVLVLQGNPVVSQVPQYRKTLILECKNLTYLDSRPVFPKDRACAEAWKRGGYEEERREHDRWIKMDRKKIRDSVNATLRLRQRHGDADVQLLESTDEEEDNRLKPKKRKTILDKVTPDLEITGVDRSEEDDTAPTTSNDISDAASGVMGDSSTSLQPAGTFNPKEEECDNTPQMLIQSDDMPAEREDANVSRSPEGFEKGVSNGEGMDIQPDEKPTEKEDVNVSKSPETLEEGVVEGMEIQSDKKLVEVEGDRSAPGKLQYEEKSVDKLDDMVEKTVQPSSDELLVENEEVNLLEPPPLELQSEQNSIVDSDDILKNPDGKLLEIEEDTEMQPNQDHTVSQSNERVNSSGSEPDLQEVVKACIAKSSRYNPVLMKSAPAFSRQPSAWKRFNSSDSSSTSTSDLSSDESDTLDESEDMAMSDKETNISEPKDIDIKILDEELVTNEIPDEEALPTATGVEVSDFAIDEAKTSVTAVPTEAAIEEPDFEVAEVKTSAVTVEPFEDLVTSATPDEEALPSETGVEVSDFAMDEAMTSVTAEPTETNIGVSDFEVGEVKASIVTVERFLTEMEVSDFAVDEAKTSITVDPTEIRMEASDFEEANTSVTAEPTETTIGVPDFELGEVKASVVTVEPFETGTEVSDFAVDEANTSITAEPTETTIGAPDFEVGEVKASVATVEPEPFELETGIEVSGFATNEDKANNAAAPTYKTNVTANPFEIRMESSDFEVGEVESTGDVARLTRSGTIDLFAMELTNVILNNPCSVPHLAEVQESDKTSKEKTTAAGEHTVHEHVDLQDSTLEDRDSLSQSLKSDHDLDTTNWSFTEPDDSMPESLKMFDEKDTFDTDNSQAIDLSEVQDSGLVNSFQTTCISSEFENQDRATSVDDDSLQRSTPKPNESSAVALAGLEDILCQVCQEEEEKALSSEEASHTQACKEIGEIYDEEPSHADDKQKTTEDPEVSSWLEHFLTALRKKEEKIRNTSFKEKTAGDFKFGLDNLSAIMEEAYEDLTQMEAGLSNKTDDKELTFTGQELTTSSVKTEDQKPSDKSSPENMEDLTTGKKNSGPPWLEDILKSLREKEDENEGDNTVIHREVGLFSKVDSSNEQLHFERSYDEQFAFKEREAEKTGTWSHLDIEKHGEDTTIHSEEASSNQEIDCLMNDEQQSTDDSTEGNCEADKGNAIDRFTESLTTFAASLDGQVSLKQKPDHWITDSSYVQVPLTTDEPEPLAEVPLTWWQQTLAAARTTKDSKPSLVPEAATPPTDNDDTTEKRRCEEELSENQTLEEKAEAFRLLETVLAATRKEEIESLIIEPEVKEVVNELMQEDTQSTSSCDSSYHEEPLETKPTPTLRQVLDSFNAIQETVVLRTQERSQRIRRLIDNPLTKDFSAQNADDINRQVEEMKMDQRKRINDMIDKVYAQKDKYNDTLEVVNGRLMVVKRGTGALEELPSRPPAKYYNCDVSTDPPDNTTSKYVSCGVSTNQTDNTSKYSSCGVSTNPPDNTPSKYASCGVSTNQTDDTSKYSSYGVSTTPPPSSRNIKDSESDDYGTALSDQADNDDDDGCDIEQHASDTKIKRIPYFVAGCTTLSQSSSNISQEGDGDEDEIVHFDCYNEQQYESLRKVQQLHKDIDEELFVKASKWMAEGLEIPPMQPPVLEKRQGKEEEMLMKNFMEMSEIPPDLYNDLQSFMDFDEEALEDISLMFETPDV